jgi:hexokinase
LSNWEVQLGIGIGMNDTPAVAQDGGAAKNARDEGYKVKPTGFVFGTGTNAAFEERADEGKGKRNGAIDDAGGSANEPGLVNSEIGHAAWTDDPVSERLRQRLVEQGLLSESRKDVAELEHETGSYIPRRIAAAVTILGEEIIPNAANVATQIEDMAVESPSLVSDLATGATTLTEDNSTNTMLKGLALASLDRAKQVYALILATISEKVQGTEESQEKSAVLTEGSTIHRATKGGTDTLKRGTEIEAAKLGQEVTIIRASGLKGVGGVTMSWHELVKKA